MKFVPLTILFALLTCGCGTRPAAAPADPLDGLKKHMNAILELLDTTDCVKSLRAIWAYAEQNRAEIHALVRRLNRKVNRSSGYRRTRYLNRVQRFLMISMMAMSGFGEKCRAQAAKTLGVMRELGFERVRP